MQAGRQADRDVLVTGIGIVSSLAGDLAGHQSLLGQGGAGVPNLNASAFAGYTVHPLSPVDFSKQIASKAEQRQMGTWQRIGVYAAGLALESAGLIGKPELLDKTDLIVAAGNGERDLNLDQKVLETLSPQALKDGALNEALLTGLRPTLYLGELSNLLAGNIQIVHHVTGSTRTYKGEELAGVSAIENAVRRISAGQSDIILAGGALNAEREDLLLNYELGGNLWRHPFKPVWQRREAGGGFVAGSMGAFLVLEARRHAETRGVKPFARIATVLSDYAPRQDGSVRRSLADLFGKAGVAGKNGPIAVLSGASGVEMATREELDCLSAIDAGQSRLVVRAYGTAFGHGVEAHFPMGVALAALALDQERFFQPFEQSGIEQEFAGAPDRVIVSGIGHWRGEGIAVLDRASLSEAA